MNDIEKDNFNGPWDGERYDIMGLAGRRQYIIADGDGVMITFPDNDPKHWNYQATATALARMTSIAIQAKIDINKIKKQLKESSIQEGDTPHIILQAVQKYEDKKARQGQGYQGNKK
jgi:hypothetical protein